MKRIEGGRIHLWQPRTSFSFHPVQRGAEVHEGEDLFAEGRSVARRNYTVQRGNEIRNCYPPARRIICTAGIRGPPCHRRASSSLLEKLSSFASGRKTPVFSSASSRWSTSKPICSEEESSGRGLARIENEGARSSREIHKARWWHPKPSWGWNCQSLDDLFYETIRLLHERDRFSACLNLYSETILWPWISPNFRMKYWCRFSYFYVVVRFCIFVVLLNMHRNFIWFLFYFIWRLAKKVILINYW